MNTFRVCTRCKKLIIKGDGSVWYNRYCGGVCNERARDPFDGRWKWAIRSDLGGVAFVDEQHPYVRDINSDGKCSLFEEKS